MTPDSTGAELGNVGRLGTWLKPMHPGVRQALIAVLVAGAYYASGYFGIVAKVPPASIPTLWPPAAVLLSALLLTERRYWWTYLVTVGPTHIYLFVQCMPTMPPLAMVFQFLGYGAQAYVTAEALRYFDAQPVRFDDLRGVIRFNLIAALGVPILVTTVVVYLYTLTGWTTEFWLVWSQRLLSNVVATVTLVPLIVATVQGGRACIERTALRRFLEFGALMLAVLAVAYATFGGETTRSHAVPVLLYALLPLLLWAAVRFQPAGVYSCLVVIAMISLIGAYYGRGPFLTLSRAQNVLALQLFLVAVSVPMGLLSALVEERQRAEQALRASNEHIRKLAGRLITAQEEERRRIARDLHDDLNQKVAALSIEISNMKQRLPGADSSLINELNHLQTRTVELVTDIRDLSHEIHPAILEHAGLLPALTSYAAELNRMEEFDLQLSLPSSSQRIPPTIAIGMYRIAQESIRNVVKHSGMRRAAIALTLDDHSIGMRVTDEGRGFNVAHVRENGGLGLISIEERVLMLNGELEVRSEQGRGTTLEVHVPLPA